MFIHKIQYSYQIFSQNITSFFWILQMKLRHKKPLNPYKGQTNNDKNEFNDDDFRQQGSPHKKNGNSSGDQIFKYARILSKFIKTINQDCRQFAAPSEDPDLPLSIDGILPKAKPQFDNERETALSKKQQLKELKQISKLQAKIQLKQENRDIKLPPRKKETQQTNIPLKELKNPSFNLASGPPFSQNLQQTPAKNQFQNRNKEPNRLPFDKPDQNRTNFEAPGLNRPPQARTSGNLPAAGSLPMGAGVNGPMNMGNYLNLPANFPSMVGQNPMLGNLNLMGVNGLNGMNGLNPMQMTQLLLRYNNPNYIYGGFPVNMNNMGMMGMGVTNMPNGSNTGFMFQQPKPNQKPIQNLFKQQVDSFKQTEETPRGLIQAYPLKRSAYHVAISYKIYLDRLKKEGQTFENLDDIDPTKNARRIKSSQQGKTGREASKKKK